MPGRTALVTGGVTPSGQLVAYVLRVLRATGAARAAEVAPPHVVAPLPLLPRPAQSAGSL
ncbi:hypothetical protein [Streptomyces ochraceiscleroticus]|uniref:Uncharacterized protein n=1 Tax=Streptomyces ochraceiscleroticus TaxID=47761 RepID=A0ABW1MSV0_9ACTN|nr:hypothetical protein [Streptomyces ochraceiscleroticus]